MTERPSTYRLTFTMIQYFVWHKEIKNSSIFWQYRALLMQVMRWGCIIHTALNYTKLEPYQNTSCDFWSYGYIQSHPYTRGKSPIFTNTEEHHTTGNSSYFLLMCYYMLYQMQHHECTQNVVVDTLSSCSYKSFWKKSIISKL